MSDPIIVEKINNQPFQMDYSDFSNTNENKNNNISDSISPDTIQTNTKDSFFTIVIIELLKTIIIYGIIVSILLVAFKVLHF